MQTGYFAALGTLLCWTISLFVLTGASRRIDPGMLNRAILFICIFLLGITVCIIDGINPLELFSKPSFSNWLWLGISGIMGKSLGDYLGFSCVRILGASKRAVITTLTPAITMIFGLFILGEYINVIGVAGMGMTILSLIFLLNSQQQKEEVRRKNFGNYTTGVMMGIAADACTALGYIFSKLTLTDAQNQVSQFHAAWIRVIVAFAALFLIDIVLGKKIQFLRPVFQSKHNALLVMGAVIFGVVLGSSLSLIAITHLEVAVAYTIFCLVPLTVMIGAVLFFRKKISPLAWLLSFTAVAGVALLVWTNAY